MKRDISFNIAARTLKSIGDSIQDIIRTHVKVSEPTEFNKGAVWAFKRSQQMIDNAAAIYAEMDKKINANIQESKGKQGTDISKQADGNQEKA